MIFRFRLSLIVIFTIVMGFLAFGSAVATESAQIPRVPIDADLPVQYDLSGMLHDSVIIEFNSYAESRSAQVANIIPGVNFEDAMSSRPIARYRITDGGTPFETISRLRNLSNIKEVYPNYRRSAAVLPNDPYWQLQKEEMLVAQLPAAWDIHTGTKNVLVAVIDTGVDYTHPDLIPNLVLPGINVREDWVPEEVMDDSGHGTAVCGVIGGVGNNGVGVAGVNWTINMLPIRACGGPLLDCDLFDEVEAIDAARERGVDVINLSIGGVGTISIEEKAVTEAYKAGIVIVAAAGNSNPGVYYKATGDPTIDRPGLYYPAALPEVIGVGAVDNNGLAADFSNYGEDILAIMAPGVDIVTTVPEDEVYLYNGEGPPYGLASGTSFATPMVAGVAALILSYFPGLGPDDVRARLVATAIPMAGPDSNANGINDYYGHGILNAYSALSQKGSSGNQYFEVAVAANPIFAGEILVMAKALIGLDKPPTVVWSALGSSSHGTFEMAQVESRPGFFMGSFTPGATGNISVSVTGMSNGAPLPPVSILYILSE